MFRKVASSGLNTEVMEPPCVWQAPAGVRQVPRTSREGRAGLRPHTTNTSPSAKPGCPNMGIRELHVNLAANCLHHAGRGGVVSTEKHLFSPETSPRVCCFPPSHPHHHHPCPAPQSQTDLLCSGFVTASDTYELAWLGINTAWSQ